MSVTNEQQQQLQPYHHNDTTYEIISSDNLINNSNLCELTTTDIVYHHNDNEDNCEDVVDNDNDDAAATLNFINRAVMNDIVFSHDEVNFVDPALVNHNDSATLTAHIFSTPHSLCIKSTTTNATNRSSSAANFDDEAAHWHGSSDLLELDHRYNSCLQAELLHGESTSVIMTMADSESIADLSEYIELKSKTHFPHQLSPPTMAKSHNQVQHMPSVAMEQQQTQEQNSQVLRVSSDSESDFEDRNLSWLLNFKFDELPHLSPDTTTLNSKGKMNLNLNSVNIQPLSKNLKKGSNGTSMDYSANMPNDGMLHNNNADGSSSSPMKAGKKFEELVMEATSEMDCNDNATPETTENIVIDDMSFRMGKKPPFTYTELIEYALEDKGELTVSGIYQWISDRFPYYKSNDDRWKNSVRHNLSINPHFRKGAKASQGAGHLWTISSGDTAESALAWEHKKQRLELFFKMESANIKRIQQHHLKHQRHEKEQQEKQKQKPHHHQQQQQQQQFGINQCENNFYDEAATAAEIISREMITQEQHHDALTNDHLLHNQHMVDVNTTTSTTTSPTAVTTTCSSAETDRTTITTTSSTHFAYHDMLDEEELRRTAGQILNGIHRDVEVQSVNAHVNNYPNILLENDYLCETNFAPSIGNSHYVGSSATNHHNLNNISQFNIGEIDSMELGIQMSHHVDNEEILFNDELGLNFFGYNVNSDIAT